MIPLRPRSMMSGDACITRPGDACVSHKLGEVLPLPLPVEDRNPSSVMRWRQPARHREYSRGMVPESREPSPPNGDFTFQASAPAFPVLRSVYPGEHEAFSSESPSVMWRQQPARHREYSPDDMTPLPWVSATAWSEAEENNGG